jgi:hypothetical protein
MSSARTPCLTNEKYYASKALTATTKQTEYQRLCDTIAESCSHVIQHRAIISVASSVI